VNNLPHHNICKQTKSIGYCAECKLVITCNFPELCVLCGTKFCGKCYEIVTTTVCPYCQLIVVWLLCWE